jgi:hypothetical protein
MVGFVLMGMGNTLDVFMIVLSTWVKQQLCGLVYLKDHSSLSENIKPEKSGSSFIWSYTRLQEFDWRQEYHRHIIEQDPMVSIQREVIQNQQAGPTLDQQFDFQRSMAVSWRLVEVVVIHWYLPL